MAWTTPEDIKDLYIGSDILPTDLKLTKLISIMENQIVKTYPAIQTRIDSQELALSTITDAVSIWILEYLQTGGEAITQESQSYTGAVSRSVSYNSSKRRVSLELSSNDLSTFAPSDGDMIMGLDIGNSYRSSVWLSIEDFDEREKYFRDTYGGGI